jgi:FKBP-type peptidyl-prolyl cis-trans isomerase FklB
MNKIVPALLGCALTITTLSPAFASQGLETQKDKLSYTIGLQMGMQLATIKEKVDLDTVLMAIKEGQAETKPKLSEEEMRAVMASFQEEMKAEQQAQAVLRASVNKEAAKTFLAENESKEGVITLDSGLQYKVLTKGSGASPAVTDTVRVHYRGSLINGQEFDSTFKRGEPIEFPVNRVIAGWTEALQLMKEGSKWQLFIPADLAYGERGSGQIIGPNAMLIFEVELLEIKKGE